MAPEPAALESYVTGGDMDDDPDADGEYEDDPDMEQAAEPLSPGVQESDADGSDMDAEGEEIDEDEDALGEEDDEVQGVGAVKIPEGEASSSESEEDDDDKDDAGVDMDDSSDAASDSDRQSESSSSESDAENEWEAESDTTGGEAPSAGPESGLCLHCHQKEDDDPSEEYEEYLTCAVCGDNAHRQCARDAKSFRSDDDPEHWRCASCLENGLEEDSKPSSSRRRPSVPKMSRDLLATQPGTNKRDAHSVFNTLIHPDDPMDGSRSLRKRKGSPDTDPASARGNRKRRRGSESSSRSTSVESSRSSSSESTERETSVVEPEAPPEAVSEPENSSLARSIRPRRATVQQKLKMGANVVLSDGISFVVAFKVKNRTRLKKILNSRPKKKLKKDKSRKNFVPEPEMSHYPSISTNYTPFFAFPDKEADEKNQKPYGGILSEAEADTSKTFPQPVDRKKFEDARLRAEEDWKNKMANNNTLPEPTRTPHKMSGPPSKIKCINFGGWEIDTWHAAPYPEEYTRNRVLYICEFCLKYMSSDYVAWRHKLKCPAKHPPGDEIYRDGRFSFFEVDGRKNPVYCQNLCLLAKLFLGSKTLYYDVEPFLFYVMTENNDYGCHFVGYFSKEKRPSSMNNVSCILVLPIHQRKGFGHMLIEFSYLLTRVEKKTGSPEKPLSDMGLVSYRSYWRLVLCYQLISQRSPLSIMEISDRTGMTADDIVSGLEGLRALVRDPVTKTYALRLDYKFFKEYIDKFESKNWPKIRPEALVWTPYVMGRTNLSHYDEAPPLHTVAQREEESADSPEEGAQRATASSVTSKSYSKDADAGMSEAPTPLADGDAAPSPDANLFNGAGSIPSLSITTANPAAFIPPTRFEIFPPIPGQPSSHKRRPGRPFGSRRRTSTPLRRANSAMGGKNLLGLQQSPSSKPSPLGLGINGASTGNGMRRTRSKLGELINGIGDHEDAEKENENDDDLVNGDDMTPTRKRGKGKDAARDLDDLALGDASGDDDEDADADAEGEVDSDVDVDDDADGDADADGDLDAEGDEDAEGEIDEDLVMADAAVHV